ncbi:MAG: YncE family protein [Phycisphaerae bacterium]
MSRDSINGSRQARPVRQPIGTTTRALAAAPSGTSKARKRVALYCHVGLLMAACAAIPSCAQPERTVQHVPQRGPAARLPDDGEPGGDEPPSDVARATPQTASDSRKAVRPTVQTVEQVGVSVECTLTPIAQSQPRSIVYPGDDLEVRFRVTDATTNSPLTNLNPAAWIDPQNANASESCQSKIQSFLTGSLGARAEFDLNVFYVLALNDEPSITVVDPLFSYGGSRLLAMVQLPSPGEDWVLSNDGNRLYVTMPKVNQVGVVDTTTWRLIQNIDVGTQPTRIRRQPDGKYLWVSCVDLTSGAPGGRVHTIDTDTLDVVGRFPFGAGHHDFAFSADSRFAYVSNKASESVFVIDIGSMANVATVDIGASAGAMAYSAASRCVYVVDGVEGNVVVIDDRTHQVIGRIGDAPGLGVIEAAPNDRYIFVANAQTDTVHIIDAASNAIIQTADVGPGPDQIIFTLNLAYIRSERSEIVLMIPMDQVGSGGRLSVVDFTGGHAPFGLVEHPSLAAGMAAAPSGVAAVVANPVDRAIYYYREGMAAPMGEFSNYGRQPRAVLVVDRSLQETEPGVYSTTVRLSRSGTFDVAFLLDSPRIVHCFELQVDKQPGATEPKSDLPVQIEPIIEQRQVAVGESVRVRYKVRDTDTGRLLTNIRDLSVLAFSSNNWQQRVTAASISDGLYEATFTPPHSGVYYVFCQIPSMSVGYRTLPHTTVIASTNRNNH